MKLTICCAGSCARSAAARPRFRRELQRLRKPSCPNSSIIAPISSPDAILILTAETAEEISKRPEIRKELQRATGEKCSDTVKARGRDKLWFIIQALILIGCVAVYFLVGSKLVPLPQASTGVIVRILRGTALIVIVLGIARVISVYALGRIEDSSTRFTLQRVMHLVVALVILVIAISIIFVNWYGALAALGIGSVIIGLAVQTPMKSFIAWNRQTSC